MPAVISDLDMQAFVDGELDPVQADSVRDAMAGDAALRLRYEQLIRQKNLIAAAWTEDRLSVH